MPSASFTVIWLVRLQVVGAEVQLRAGGEEHVSVLQDVAERDVLERRETRCCAARCGRCLRTGRSSRPRSRTPCCRAASRCTGPPAAGDTRSDPSKGSSRGQGLGWRRAHTRRTSTSRRRSPPWHPRTGGESLVVVASSCHAFRVESTVCPKVSSYHRSRPVNITLGRKRA